MSREGQGSLGKGENYRRRFFLIFAHGKGLGWTKTFPQVPPEGLPPKCVVEASLADSGQVLGEIRLAGQGQGKGRAKARGEQK